MTKKGSSVFFKKNRVTPSLAAPGDTNPSDATGCPGGCVCVSPYFSLRNAWKYFNETHHSYSLHDTDDIFKVMGLKVKVMQRRP